MTEFDLTPDTKINIRPSGASSFLACPRKWAATTLMGYRGWGSFQTVRGTGVHAGAEQIWRESITKGEKVINLLQAQDAAVQAVEQSDESEDIRYDKYDFSSNLANAKDSAAEGAKAYCELALDIDVPKFVEHTMQIDIGDNVIVKGTADYISHDGMVEDIKTSARKATPQQHVLQLGIYAKLAQHNGVDANMTDSRIQNIAYTKNKTSGYLLPFKLDEHLSTYVVNDIKDRVVLARQKPIRDTTSLPR